MCACGTAVLGYACGAYCTANSNLFRIYPHISPVTFWMFLLLCSPKSICHEGDERSIQTTVWSSNQQEDIHEGKPPSRLQWTNCLSCFMELLFLPLSSLSSFTPFPSPALSSLPLPPTHQVLCGLPVYVKFAGAAVSCLRRWLTAETIPSDEKLEEEFLASVHKSVHLCPSFLLQNVAQYYHIVFLAVAIEKREWSNRHTFISLPLQFPLKCTHVAISQYHTIRSTSFLVP